MFTVLDLVQFPVTLNQASTKCLSVKSLVTDHLRSNVFHLNLLDMFAEKADKTSAQFSIFKLIIQQLQCIFEL